MTEKVQLDLFDSRGSAVIVAFPLHRNVGAVRKVASAILRRRSEHAQQSEFNRSVAAMADRLQKAGLGDGQVRRQLEAFTRAVNNELYHRQMTQRRHGPGGAA